MVVEFVRKNGNMNCNKIKKFNYPKRFKGLCNNYLGRGDLNIIIM